MSFGKLYVLKSSFQTLGRFEYQFLCYASLCQVRNIPFQEQTKSFCLMCNQEIYIFEESQFLKNRKPIKDVTEDV